MKKIIMLCALMVSLSTLGFAQRVPTRNVTKANINRVDKMPTLKYNSSRIQPEQKKHIRERQEILHQKLDLSPIQEKKIKAIKKDTREKIQIVKSDAKLSRVEKENKLQFIIKDAELKRNDVLTPDQKKIFDEEMEIRKSQKQ